MYSDELRVEICRRLAKGESLRRICSDPHIPHIDTVLAWALDDQHEFSGHYARARRIQAEMLIDELKDIADDSGNDVTVDEDGKERVNHDVIQRAKLRIDTRKWIGVKILPKVYGDRVEVITPPEKAAPPLSPEEKLERGREALRRWGAGGALFAPRNIQGETADE